MLKKLFNLMSKVFWDKIILVLFMGSLINLQLLAAVKSEVQTLQNSDHTRV